MRITICYLDLVSKHENNRTKISISSRQVRAINIILDLVSIFLHISRDILKSSYIIHFSLRQLMEHQQKKVKFCHFWSSYWTSYWDILGHHTGENVCKVDKNHWVIYFFCFLVPVRKILKNTVALDHPVAMVKKHWLCHVFY